MRVETLETVKDLLCGSEGGLFASQLNRQGIDWYTVKKALSYLVEKDQVKIQLVGKRKKYLWIDDGNKQKKS